MTSDDPRDGAAPLNERARLLSLVAGHILDHGVAGLTLRNLGKAIGTNNRMLLYYFESKEKLIQSALEEAGTWEPRFYGTLVDLTDSTAPLPDRLRASWAGVSHPGNRPYIRLFFEIYGLALHDTGRYDEFLRAVGTNWLGQLAEAIRAEGVADPTATDLAQEVLALWRGLQFLLAANGDVQQTSEINDRFVVDFHQRVLAARS